MPPAVHYDLAADLTEHVGADAAEMLTNLAQSRVLFADEVLYRQGVLTGTPTLYIVLRGLLLVEQRTQTGAEGLLAVLGPGDLAGVVGAIDPHPRRTTLLALVSSHVLEVSRTDLFAWTARHADAAQWMLRAVAQRIERAEAELVDKTVLDSAERLAGVLLELRRWGHEDADGTVLETQLTQLHLARLVGCTRETVNKALRTFSDRGWVESSRSRLVVRDAEGLRALSTHRQKRRVDTATTT